MKPLSLPTPHFPAVLLILDGWGVSRKKIGNAIATADTPVFNHLLKTYPSTTLGASGRDVGLPAKQAGNSEAGHLNIGAGRIVESDAVRIDRDIANGTFFKQAAFFEAIRHVRKQHSSLHVMALLSGDQSPHASLHHLTAFLKLARQEKVKEVFLHLFTDGRDAPPFGAIEFLHALQRQLKNGERIASIMGRFYAMDRKKNWARTAVAYDAMVLGRGCRVTDPESAILAAYNRQETDEFIEPSVICQHGKPCGVIGDNDAVVFLNLRSDRARQLAKPFVQPHFERLGGFRRKKVLKNLRFVALTDFGPDLDSVITAYPSLTITNTLPVVMGHYRQLYVAESEKYAHVTYFINGGYDAPVAGEQRLRIPSPNVKNYRLRPAMAAPQITTAILNSLQKSRRDMIVANYSNADMLGHTGDFAAAVTAVEVIDHCLGEVYKAVKRHHGLLMITADHGTADEMLDAPSGAIITQHSTNPVPLVAIGSRHHTLTSGGVLANVAPTLLDMIGVPLPKDMTHHSLFS